MNQGSFIDAIVWFIMLTILFYLNREIEIMRLVGEIEGYLRLYKAVRDKALATTLADFKSVISKKGVEGIDIKLVEKRIKELVELVFISPTDLDPFGIVRKIKHLLLTSEKTLKKELKSFVPSASDAEIENTLNLLEATRALNFIYKVVNHNYMIGRKFKSLWILMQLDAQLPFITEEVRALEGAIEAFSKELPVGDSVGPIVAASLIRKYCKREEMIEEVENTIIAKGVFENRTIYVIKAKGPGGTVGHLDDALEWVINNAGRVDAIITVDAALKLEGEETGSVAEGFGVAIGGIGVEKFNIEELATKHNVPLYAVLIKMSEEEALSVIDEKLYEGIEKAIANVERFIKTRTPENGIIAIIGVGNTIGVAP
ncbi:MAG: DUF1512 domain-containing protein [Thermoproteales archaeon]|nr:DUF1512 domain-containing protein [Thermoproteales archaeon]